MRLVVQPGAPDVRGRGVLEELFLDSVFVEPGDGAQPPGDGGPDPALRLQVAGEGLDVSGGRRTREGTWRGIRQ